MAAETKILIDAVHYIDLAMGKLDILMRRSGSVYTHTVLKHMLKDLEGMAIRLETTVRKEMTYSGVDEYGYRK